MKCRVDVIRRSKYWMIYVCEKPVAKIVINEKLPSLIQIEAPESIEMPCTEYGGPYKDCMGIGCPD